MPKDFEVLVTAEEAWPSFERAVLSAEKEVLAGFRIFDMRTRLRSDEGRAVGKDWFDLLEHVLRKGVSIDLAVSDFDPVMATELHEMTWSTVKQGAALREVSGAGPDQLSVRAVLHPARAGFLPWLAFLPKVLREKNRKLRRFSENRRKWQAVGLSRTILPQMHTVSHHQKVAVIDGEVLYIGGLDLNERRYDTPAHDRPAHQTWSDIQLILRGPEAQNARRHLQTYEATTAGKIQAPACPHLKRTLSAPRRIQFPYISPRTLLSEIEEAHFNAFRKARHLILIETQFLRSQRIADAMAAAAAKNTDLSSMIILPALPDDVAFENSDGLDAQYGMALQKEALEKIIDAFGDRVTLATPVQPVLAARTGPAVHSGSPVIHVHNKLLLKDDDYALVGSANLNGRSMRWDTEVAVEITRPERLSELTTRIFRHWWQDALADVAVTPEGLQPSWHAEIIRNGVRLPQSRKGYLVPYDISRGSDMAQPLPGVTEDIV
jgi:hypothetical protein